MIKTIKVTNYLNETLIMELTRPDLTGFNITKITGLDPVKAEINCTDVASYDGSVFNSARKDTRNIVLTIHFENRYGHDIEELRHKIYKYFPVKRELKIEVLSDKRESYSIGYVEDVSIDQFTSKEFAQISIICPDPFFYSDKIITTTFHGVEDLFEFPFSNESLTENLIEFGKIRNEVMRTIYYDGDSDVGVKINIHMLGLVKHITIYNTSKREILKLDTDRITTYTGSELSSGDEIIINTVKGSKSIYLLREGEYINILNCLDKNAVWFQLSKGDNVFVYTAEYGIDNINFTMQHQIAYEGS